MGSLAEQNATLVEMLKQAGIEHEAQIVSARIQAALTDEIHHRTKNMLAMVSAIVRQTMRSAVSLEEAEKSISLRLVAMSTAHDVLLKRNSQSASLAGIVSGAMEQHVTRAAQLVVLGEDFSVLPSAVLPLALILNELATNAAKYGALSNDAGRVSLRWSRDVRAGKFLLWWEESGGPPVSVPQERGFGSRLLERAIPGQLGGGALLTFAGPGVRYALHASLAKMEYRGADIAAAAAQ